MFGINGAEFVILLLLAALLLGPRSVAQALHGLKKALTMFRQWSARLRADALSESSALTPQDLKNLQMLREFDLSQYSPKQMVREAVQDEINEWMKQAGLSATSLKDAVQPVPDGTPSTNVTKLSIQQLDADNPTGGTP
ncbi:MAG: hypothetical protein E6474_06935 [Actinomyces sp.]|nr:hypothetical protein [Actinomyces sp.]